MKSRYRSVDEQQQKENEEKLTAEVEMMHRRGKVGDYTEVCPICNRIDSMIVVINKTKAVANCSRCKVGVSVKF